MNAVRAVVLALRRRVDWRRVERGFRQGRDRRLAVSLPPVKALEKYEEQSHG